MKSVVVGDIHNLVGKLRFLPAWFDKLEKSCDEIIFLGDYFDSHGDDVGLTERTAEWLLESITHPKRIHLFGNHDMQYAYPKNHYLQCSGYSKNKSDVINYVMKRTNWNRLKYFYESNNFIFSHAGFSLNKLHPVNGYDYDHIKKSIMNEISCMGINFETYWFGAGRDRGGHLEQGGITWLDWNSFEPIHGMNQIVGHTKCDAPKYKIYNNSVNVNVDCFPNYLLIIEDGKLREMELMSESEE